MAKKKKFYAVRLGRKPGIYESWDECKEQIDGLRGAVYKSFLTREEAEAFLHGRDLAKMDILDQVTPECPVAITDGSYEHELGRYGYGAVILEDTGEGEPKETELYGCGSNPQYLESRNIVGEALGVLKTLQWAVGRGYTKIRIYYDYEGLEKWATGEWKAKSPVAQAYADTLRKKFAHRIEVHFVKVKGHSNNHFNDRADALAKKGVAEGPKS